MKQPKPRDPTIPRTGARRLVIGTATWWWHATGGNVSVWSPDRKRHNINPHVIIGTDPGTFDDGQWDGSRGGMVCPHHVRAFIEALP